MVMNTLTTAQAALLNRICSALRASPEPMSLAHIRDAIGIRHLPSWELDQLEAAKLVKRAAHRAEWSVDRRYELAR